jgi:UrcA family protein
MRSLQRLPRRRHALVLALLAVVAPSLAFAASPPAPVDTPANHGSRAEATSSPAAFDAAAAPSVRLSYRDLNLSTPEGIATLYLRIHHAAVQVCDANHYTTGTRIDPAIDRCVQAAVAATVKQIGSPGLAALELEQRALGVAADGAKSLCDRPARAKLII